MSYDIHYCFDPGSGVCLWSENEEARERFGYPVDHWQLPLTENTRRFLQYLIAWFDTSIDWSSPSDMDDYWSEEELIRFKSGAAKGLEMLRQELSSNQYRFTNAMPA